MSCLYRRPLPEFTLAVYLFASGAITLLFALVNALNWMVGMGVFVFLFILGAWGALCLYPGGLLHQPARLFREIP